jgi:methylated-DNA-protein-cysteine methyltransferase-like protein
MSYDRIWATVKQVPPGFVSTYGRIAELTGAATPRVVGYAMAALPDGTDVPWHRIINSRGEISLRRRGTGHARQKRLLRKEGIRFDRRGRVDLDEFGWPPGY